MGRHFPWCGTRSINWGIPGAGWRAQCGLQWRLSPPASMLVLTRRCQLSRDCSMLSVPGFQVWRQISQHIIGILIHLTCPLFTSPFGHKPLWMQVPTFYPACTEDYRGRLRSQHRKSKSEKLVAHTKRAELCRDQQRGNIDHLIRAWMFKLIDL